MEEVGLRERSRRLSLATSSPLVGSDSPQLAQEEAELADLSELAPFTRGLLSLSPRLLPLSPLSRSRVQSSADLVSLHSRASQRANTPNSYTPNLRAED